MNRYKRQMAVEGIGKEGQERLMRGSVMVIGCGALGSLAAMYLAGSGVGRIGIADFDTVDVSNLQRQLFFSEAESGKKKCSLLAERMRSLNSEITVEEHHLFLTPKVGKEILCDYDFIIDATDNPASKIMTDRLCEEIGKPCCIGGVEGFRGQLLTILPGDERYREIFADIPEDPGLTPCAIAGVMGPAAGVIASLEAMEAIKYLSGCGKLCRNRILDIDLRDLRFSSVEL